MIPLAPSYSRHFCDQLPLLSGWSHLYALQRDFVNKDGVVDPVFVHSDGERLKEYQLKETIFSYFKFLRSFMREFVYFIEISSRDNNEIQSSGF